MRLSSVSASAFTIWLSVLSCEAGVAAVLASLAVARPAMAESAVREAAESVQSGTSKQ